MAEAGRIGDGRCADALDLLASRELAAGGWPAESRHYTSAGAGKDKADHVDWGGSGAKRMNEWVTASALAVIAAAGRL